MKEKQKQKKFSSFEDLGVAGWVREGRKGKAELVFLPTNECK